jgi:pimeloyl-ACP methyl ester carboxylesterase
MSARSRSFVEALESRQLLSAGPAGELGIDQAQVQPAAIRGTVTQGNQTLPVSLVRADGRQARLFANRKTWIVIHGWNQAPRADYIRELGLALQARSKRIQVLMLDWSRPAGRPLLEAFTWAGAVGNWAAGQLEGAGVPPGRINIIGHSLGAQVAGEMARSVDGNVARIVALDPASDPFGLTVNFAADTQYSIAFVGSRYSSTPAAFTADDTFRVNVGPFNALRSHLNVVNLFTTMVQRNDAGNPDRISRLFDIKRLSPKASQPWQPDAFSGGFEGVLTGRATGGRWVPATLSYRHVVTGQAVTIRAQAQSVSQLDAPGPRLAWQRDGEGGGFLFAQLGDAQGAGA